MQGTVVRWTSKSGGRIHQMPTILTRFSWMLPSGIKTETMLIRKAIFMTIRGIQKMDDIKCRICWNVWLLVERCDDADVSRFRMSRAWDWVETPGDWETASQTYDADRSFFVGLWARVCCHTTSELLFQVASIVLCTINHFVTGQRRQ